MGMPNIGKIKSEVSELENKKSELGEAREKIRAAISELGGKKNEIESNLNKLHDKLAEEIPPQVKQQIIEQIAVLKNALSQIRAQLTMLRERMGFIQEAMTNISQGIGMRKQALQAIAGQLAQAAAVQNNREQGRVKG